MCFMKAPKAPKPPRIPKPPPLPLPVDPQKAAVEGEDEMIRRQKAALAPRASTVVTSPTGDPKMGESVAYTGATGTKLVA